MADPIILQIQGCRECHRSDPLMDFFIDGIAKKLEIFMAKVSDLEAILNGLNITLTKGLAEVNQKLSALEAALANVDVELPVAVTGVLESLRVSVDALDAIVPDAVEPSPEVPIPPAEVI